MIGYRVHFPVATGSCMRPSIPLLASCVLVLAACGREAPPPPRASAAEAPASAPAVATVPQALPSDPGQAILAASQRFTSLRSFHADMTLHGAQAGQVTQASLDFVAPDRYRIQGVAGTQVVIGDTFFLQAGDRIEQLPVQSGLLDQWRNPLPAEATLAEHQVEDRGVASLDGETVRHFLVHGPERSGETLQYWLGADGWPRQVQRDGYNKGEPYRLTLRYSRLNDPTLQVSVPGAAGQRR